MTTSTPEPSADATTYDGITTRINWLILNIQGIQAQLSERRGVADDAWRSKATNALNYRLAELRSQKLRRRQLAAPDGRSRELLRRVVTMIADWGVEDDADTLDQGERALLAEVKECLA